MSALPVTDLNERRAAKITVAALDQVGVARDRLGINPIRQPRLPWDTLHDLLGYIWPESFWVIAASTGNGKSSTLMQIVNAWVDERRRVYMLPLEQPASVMRLYWAALSLRYDPRRVLENDWGKLPSDAPKQVHAHLSWQQSEEARKLIAFSDAPFIGEAEILPAFEDAATFGASVIVIDHLHRIRLQGSNSYGALVSLCQTIKECAKRFQVPVLSAAQIHRGDGDVLAPFLPPKPTAIQGGEVVRQEADVAIGLYRPLLSTFSPEDARQVRLGQSRIKPHLEPNTVGVHVLKHRVRGDMLGEIVKLRYEFGRIICPQTEDRLAYERREDLQAD